MLWWWMVAFNEIRQPMQNNTPIAAKWSRWKPEVEFQYGGLLFFKTGSSYRLDLVIFQPLIEIC